MRSFILALVLLAAALPVRSYVVSVDGREFHEPNCPMGCLVKSVLFSEWVQTNWPKDANIMIPLDFTIPGREIRHSVCLFQHNGQWLIYDSTQGIYPLAPEAYPNPKEPLSADKLQYGVQVVLWNRWRAMPLHETLGSPAELPQVAYRFREGDHASYKSDYMGGPALTFTYRNQLFVYLWKQGTRLLEDPESSLYSGASSPRS